MTHKNSAYNSLILSSKKEDYKFEKGIYQVDSTNPAVLWGMLIQEINMPDT